MPDKLKKIIAELKKNYQANYGDTVFEITYVLMDDRLIVGGRVLLEKQKQALLEKLGEVFADKIIDRITVLAELKENPPLGFWRPKAGRIVDVWRKFDKDRSTQIIDGDRPVAGLLAKKNFLLVKLPDGTIGWAEKTALKKSTGKIAGGKSRKAKVSQSQFKALCEVYVGVPYLWGGTTIRGIDCSGLAQRIYRAAFGLTIPKKSTDQKNFLKAEEVTDDSKFNWGDLLFLEAKNEKKPAHVAICFEAGQNNPVFIHSCLRHKQVTVEGLEKVREYYRIVAWSKRP